MEYLRQVDFAALAAAGNTERITNPLWNSTDGGENCGISYILTPSGTGSPAGLHTHVFDQIFYILQGVMDFEIEGQQYQAGPGGAIYFPKSVPHRNWNGGTEPTVHLNFMVPCPKPGEPVGIPVQQ